MEQENIRTKYREKTMAMRQTQIAKETGIPQSVLSQFMAGKKDLWDEHLEILNDYLDKH